jgi:hypothetical protein
MWTNGGGELARRVDERIHERMRLAGGDRHILVTLSSQGDVVPSEVVEAISASSADWRYWFRLHPVNQAERREAARRILDPLGVDPRLTEFATEAPLHALLGHMDCHLSVSLSTVITEAAAIGVPSVAIGREAPDFYRSELSTGMLAVATTGPELLEAIRGQLRRGRSAPAQDGPRSLETMRRLLQGELPLAELASPCAPV